MKLTKNERLLILTLLTITLVFFLNNNYKSNNENFLNNNLDNKIIFNQIQCYIKNKYNNKLKVPTVFNMQNVEFFNTVPKPIIMNMNNNTLLYLFIDKNCLYFVHIRFSNKSYGVNIYSFGYDKTLLKYQNNDFIFSDLNGNEIVKLNKNIFLNNGKLVFDIKEHMEILNILVINASDYMRNITSSSTNGKHFMIDLKNYILTLKDKQYIQDREVIEVIKYDNNIRTNQCKKKNYIFDNKNDNIVKIEKEIATNYKNSNLNLLKSSSFLSYSPDNYYLFTNKTTPLFYKLLYYNMINELKDYRIVPNKDYNQYDIFDRNNNVYKFIVYIASQYSYHGIPSGNGVYFIQPVGTNTNEIKNHILNILKNITNRIQLKFQEELNFIAKNPFVQY